MMRLRIFILMMSLMAGNLYSQDVEFTVELSKDTVLQGDYTEVKFAIKNGEGKFTAPDFKGMRIIAGPNRSSSYSSINGVISQNSSYTYFVEFDSIGGHVIMPASLKILDKEYTTPQVKVMVLVNPDRTLQPPGSPYEKWEKMVLPAETKKKPKSTKM